MIDNIPRMMSQDEIISLATELAEAVDNRWLNDFDRADRYRRRLYGY